MKPIIIKKDKAVSPIIATILLVAITVVLAATLYTILGGYTTLLGASTPTASISVQNSSGPNTPYYTIYINQVGGNISMNKVELIIVDNNTSNNVVSVTLGDGNGYQIDGSIFNVTVYSSPYLTASTVLEITHGKDPVRYYVDKIRLVDLVTNGLIGSYSMSSA
ncbi:MAG: archaellin/type IV pilin N-terminal domain-containing protein [Thermoplasmataceae archaeon]